MAKKSKKWSTDEKIGCWIGIGVFFIVGTPFVIACWAIIQIVQWITSK